MFNCICGLSFIIVILISKFCLKRKSFNCIIKLLSFTLFVYKILYYLIENFKGNISIPVEISSLSYFLMFLIITFNIKSLYSVGAFFGLISGIGYFLFYIFFGFTVSSNFTIQQLIIGCFCHGYLFVCGLFFFNQTKIQSNDKFKIWITILAMLCWSLLFYDVETRNITFIYYIIKPKSVFVFDNILISVLIILIYYSVLVSLFFVLIKIFSNINEKVSNYHFIDTLNS